MYAWLDRIVQQQAAHYGLTVEQHARLMGSAADFQDRVEAGYEPEPEHKENTMGETTDFDPERAAAGAPIECNYDGTWSDFHFIGRDPVRGGYVVMDKDGDAVPVPARQLRMKPKSEVEQLRELVHDCLSQVKGWEDDRNCWPSVVAENLLARAVAIGINVEDLKP